MSATGTVIVPARKGLRPRQKESIAFYLFILPWMLGFVIFTFGPMIA
jgi:multiple sugar transport system permease protein